MRSKGRKGKVGSWKVESQMSLKKSSSRVEGERPSGGVTRKARERLWDSLPKCR
jgi:hypothetical protein